MNLIQKRIKRYKLGMKIGELVILAGLSFGAGTLIDEKGNISIEKNTDANTYENLDSNSIDQAQAEVIKAYIDESYVKCTDYLSQASQLVAQSEIEAFYNTYYQPVMDAYYSYTATDEIDKKEYYYKDFISKAKYYNDKISKINKNYSFDKSNYRYAKFIDGQVCLPYYGEVVGGVISEDYVVDPENGNIYVPMTKTESNDKTL